MPPQQPGWGQQPAWAPPAQKSQSSSQRPFLVILLIILLIGLGGLVYWQFGDQLLGFFTSSTGGTGGIDTKKPVITNVKTVAGETNARIDWQTNEPASSQLEYGTNQQSTSLEPAQPANDPMGGASAGVVTHSITVTGLSPSTPANNVTYHYRVRSKDAAGNEAVSDWATFQTTISDT